MKTPQKAISQLITQKEILEELKELGVGAGMILEVHASLSAFGYVFGGAQTVVNALIEAVGYSGTLLMAMQCSDNTEPSAWENPPIERHLIKAVREQMPAFNKKESDTRGMGAIVENLRRREGIVISHHPNCAYVAWGKYAKLLCNHQSLHFPLSEESPAARLYELKGSVLLMGVDYTRCTALHLAEYRSEIRPVILRGAAVELEGKRMWKKYLDLDIDSEIFNKAGKRLEEKGFVKKGKAGMADLKLFKADAAIDEAVRYFAKEHPYARYLQPTLF